MFAFHTDEPPESGRAGRHGKYGGSLPFHRRVGSVADHVHGEAAPSATFVGGFVRKRAAAMSLQDAPLFRSRPDSRVPKSRGAGGSLEGPDSGTPEFGDPATGVGTVTSDVNYNQASVEISVRSESGPVQR